MRSTRSGLAVLLAPAGVLAGHALGYLLAGSGHTGAHAVDHGYLPTAAAVAVPAVLAAVVWTVLGADRREGPGMARGCSLRFLVVAQWTLFVGQELVEHAATGDAARVVASPALWLGLVSQVAVAAAAMLFLSAASWVGGRVVAFRSGSVSSLSPAPPWPLAAEPHPVTGMLLATVSSRGPPLRRR